MIPLRRKVLWWAIYSRGFVITVQILSNLAIEDHDASDVFTWTPIHLDRVSSSPSDCAPPAFETLADQFVSFAFDGLVRWDAHHFLHVANSGYTYENNLAFFPLFPLAVQTSANAVHWIIGDFKLLNYASLLKVTAVGINLVAFVLAADVLYALSRKVLNDEYLAYKAALLFCVNPASIFFSAPYSESLYCLMAFSAMLSLEYRSMQRAGIFLALASAVRSNGIVNVGFVLYHSMKTVATETILYVRSKKKLRGRSEQEDPVTTIWRLSTNTFIPGMINVVLASAPFAAFQWYAYTTYCHRSRSDLEFAPAVVRAAEKQGLVMPGAENKSSWCFDDPPLSYPYIQKHYWNVGFLKYWEPKQAPQFLLAAPVIFLVLWQALCFVNAHRRYALRLGFVDNKRLGLPMPRDQPMTITGSLPRETFVYMVHACFLALFGLTAMHVQVTTRFILSSSPLVYWFAALLTTPAESDLVPVEPDKAKEAKLKPADPASAKKAARDKERKLWFSVEKARNLDARHSTILLQEASDSLAANCAKLYFLGYTLVGTILFSNFYPWT